MASSQDLLYRFDGVDEGTGVRRRLSADDSPLNAHAPVCVGLFRGGALTHAVYGASQLRDAVVAARRMRANGVGATLRWLNTDAWCRDLWVQDLARPLGTPPARFYGTIPAELQS